MLERGSSLIPRAISGQTTNFLFFLCVFRPVRTVAGDSEFRTRRVTVFTESVMSGFLDQWRRRGNSGVREMVLKFLFE